MRLHIENGLGWKPDPEGADGDQVSADDADYVAEIEDLRAHVATLLRQLDSQPVKHPQQTAERESARAAIT